MQVREIGYSISYMESITSQEWKVLGEMASGLARPQIAQEFSKTLATIKSQKANIVKKANAVIPSYEQMAVSTDLYSRRHNDTTVMIDGLRAGKFPPPKIIVPPEPLTSRERQVMDKLKRGLTNNEIADVLKMGRGTVKIHVSTILAKYNAITREHAAALDETWRMQNGDYFTY